MWSVGQTVHYLTCYSDETLGRAQDPEAVKAEAPLFRVLPRAWHRTLILGALNRNVVLPLPSPVVEPRGDVPLSKLLPRWNRARREMRRALDTLQGDEPRYSHPVLGPLTAAQMLELGRPIRPTTRGRWKPYSATRRSRRGRGLRHPAAGPMSLIAR